MSLTPRVKVIALAGILAVVAVVGGMQFMVPKTPDSIAAPPVAVHRLHPDPAPVAKPAKTAKKAVAHKAAAPKRHVTAKHAAAPAKKPVVHKATPAPAPAPATTTVAAPAPAPAAPAPTVAAEAAITPGLPAVLTAALRKHKVVVVCTFDPQSQVDAIAFAEAQAGARAAGAGFVGVDVLDDAVVGPFTNLLAQGSLLPDPAVFVMIRPGTLAAQFAGFADRDMVAQAAANALLK